ncbi:Asp-tRNA(Asn)/Glu-tRNA(Gln) amidotransferase subunit GatA [Sansalvadorimonas sp. 2012CJ34-2]|uniref:Glutamyl-tRNA(Gln) amidotransferase subunit A n=1 Tax=Parendozoicomonas callyspongiae TaxID=2942213 RepID=A0ABT0PCD7_9GAMM|nr:Asp-tRNA(Asn)/Glu-tRNA(Gln) amidotransferase subunit GatA [Sansalvadorimonas sp. 2012CJ34-2]MCL6268926.1 Asp-tRNA(Asn)/Glu-tRNA(Gln) amidotransferase subunit GatA [Sansalvadorimonas sp. 2012CJ34-2]
MIEKSLAELSRSLKAGEVSSVELTQTYLDRINTLGSDLNAFITVCPDIALEQAKAADEAIAAGNTTPLTGIPLAHKDLFCTQGIKTSCGSRMLDNFIAPYESTVTANFKAAGAVNLGKLNMDEFAMGGANENSYYGPVKNPWNHDMIPGGSSGGSAAAVAARLAAGTTGTDTGGSIRQPASMCGITGIKPTYGRVSRWGMVAFASSLDQAGPMARTAEDAAMMLNVMAGFDPKDSTCMDRAVPDYTATLNEPLKGLRIGLPKEYFAEGLDNKVEQVVRDAIKEYEKLGATVKEISLPRTHHSVAAYYVIAPAEASANLSRFDGARFGHRCEDPKDLEDMYKRSRAEGFGREVKNRILVGAYALSAGYYDAYYAKAQKLRRMIRDDFMSAFNEVDVIMGPTAPTPAFPIGDKTDDPVAMYLGDIFTISVNLAGLPAMSVPAGMVDGLPVGLQIIAPHFEEARLLNAGHQYQQVTDWHLAVPTGIDAGMKG